MGIFGRIADIFKKYQPTQEEIEAFEAQKIQNSITKDTKDYDFDNFSISYDLFSDIRIVREMYEPFPIECIVEIKKRNTNHLNFENITYQVFFTSNYKDKPKDILFSTIVRMCNENLIDNTKQILLEHNFLGFKQDTFYRNMSSYDHSSHKKISLKINNQETQFADSDFCYDEFDILYQKLEDILETQYYFNKILLPFLKNQ